MRLLGASAKALAHHPFGFVGAQGYQEDPNSGLKLLGHRYYDPSTGRFLTRDRAQDGRNWYDCCGSNPLVLADPTGYGGWLGKLVCGIAAAIITTVVIVSLPVDAPVLACVALGACIGGASGIIGGTIDGDKPNEMTADFVSGTVLGGAGGGLVGPGSGLGSSPITAWIAKLFAPK